MFKQTDPIFVLRNFDRRRNFDVINLWIYWLILLENYQNTLQVRFKNNIPLQCRIIKWGWEGELRVCTLGSLNFVVCKFMIMSVVWSSKANLIVIFL